MSEIAGDAISFGFTFKKILWGAQSPTGGVNSTHTHPSPLCGSNISNNKISGIWNKIVWLPVIVQCTYVN